MSPSPSLPPCRRPWYIPKGPHGIEFWKPWMQRWNIPTDTSQRVDEKNGVICLAIVFTLGVLWSLTCQKMVHFLYFLLVTAKCLSKIFNCTWKISLSSSRKWQVNGLWSYRSWDIKDRNIKKLLTQQKYQNYIFSRVDILLMVAQNPIILSIF